MDLVYLIAAVAGAAVVAAMAAGCAALQKVRP